MIVCGSLSGNSGSYRWSSNAMDVIGFGHLDAYVNAWSFRGLKNAAALYAIAVERGALKPPEPEWWPAENDGKVKKMR